MGVRPGVDFGGDHGTARRKKLQFAGKRKVAHYYSLNATPLNDPPLVALELATWVKSPYLSIEKTANGKRPR